MSAELNKLQETEEKTLDQMLAEIDDILNEETEPTDPGTIVAVLAGPSIPSSGEYSPPEYRNRPLDSTIPDEERYHLMNGVRTSSDPQVRILETPSQMEGEGFWEWYDRIEDLNRQRMECPEMDLDLYLLPIDDQREVDLTLVARYTAHTHYDLRRMSRTLGITVSRIREIRGSDRYMNEIVKPRLERIGREGIIDRINRWSTPIDQVYAGYFGAPIDNIRHVLESILPEWVEYYNDRD